MTPPAVRRDERGQVTAFVVIFMAVLVLFAGLVIDGGYTLAAKRRAMNEAQAAARAGAEVISESRYRDEGISAIDQGQARTEVKNYLDRSHPGVNYLVSFPADDTVVVDENFDQPMNILGVAGIGPMTVSGQGSARTAHGIVEENN